MNKGTVVRVHGGHYYVLDGERKVDCTLRGRLKKERLDTKLVAVGDEVLWCPVPGEEDRGIIEEILPRRAVLSRVSPVTHTEQVIMANPDQVLVVFSLANPSPNCFALDRYLVACEAAHLPVLLVANKADLVADAEHDDLVAMYRQVGYRTIITSAVTGRGLEELHEAMRKKISVMTGPSGVGKSSILNALWPELALQTGEISEYHDRGRHITVVAELLAPEPDTFVADTPGLRQFQLWDIEPEQLEAFFPEFRPYLNKCRFTPCTHTHEPGCAARQAAKRGEIPPLRYESYCRMFEGV